ncbi:hypothetical protein D3C74_43100 [compost metagenome]
MGVFLSAREGRFTLCLYPEELILERLIADEQMDFSQVTPATFMLLGFVVLGTLSVK